MKTNTRKLLAALLAVVLTLSMALTAYAATVNYGTVTVNSKYSDTSAKQVTLNAGAGWTTPDGLKITGTLVVTFPQGYYFGTPTAEEIWQFVVNGYNANHGNTDNGNGNNWNNNGITKGYRTQAQQVAESVMNKVRDEGSKTYPWSTSYVVSTTFTPKEDHCWYQFSTTLTVSYWGADGKLYTNMSTYNYSVETKRVDGVWTTYFNGVNNATGSSVTLTAEDVISDMKDAGDEVAKDLNMRTSNQQPWALIKTSTTSAAVQQVKTKLEDCGYSVSLSNSAYGTDYGTVTMRLSRSGYSGSTTVNLIVERYDSGSFWATFTGTDNRMFTLKQLLSLYQKTSN